MPPKKRFLRGTITSTYAFIFTIFKELLQDFFLLLTSCFFISHFLVTKLCFVKSLSFLDIPVPKLELGNERPEFGNSIPVVAGVSSRHHTGKH
jgi:hypothetical protein